MTKKWKELGAKSTPAIIFKSILGVYFDVLEKKGISGLFATDKILKKELESLSLPIQTNANSVPKEPILLVLDNNVTLAKFKVLKRAIESMAFTLKILLSFKSILIFIINMAVIPLTALFVYFLIRRLILMLTWTFLGLSSFAFIPAINIDP